MVSLSGLARTQEDTAHVASVLQALDDQYRLTAKIAREPGVADIIRQLFGRLHIAFGGVSRAAGQRILDIACGSNTSKAPPLLYINSPLGDPAAKIPGVEGYTALFEPWFCRILVELKADPVGIDFGDLTGEVFEHYRVDLGAEGALSFLPDGAFDAVHDSRLFGSPEFKAQFPDPADRLRIAREIRRQEQRLLRKGGRVIHSDAEDMLRGR
jgi:hypothetical protein